MNVIADFPFLFFFFSKVNNFRPSTNRSFTDSEIKIIIIIIICNNYSNNICEGLPGVLGNKGTKGKYRREQGNMTPVLGNAGT